MLKPRTDLQLYTIVSTIIPLYLLLTGVLSMSMGSAQTAYGPTIIYNSFNYITVNMVLTSVVHSNGTLGIMLLPGKLRCIFI